MKQIEQVLTDRGSKYAVSWGEAADRKAAEAFVKALVGEMGTKIA